MSCKPTLRLCPKHEAFSEHEAAPAQQEPVQPDTQRFQYIHYTASTTQKGAKVTFSEVGAQALNNYVTTAVTGGQKPSYAFKKAQDGLLLATRLSTTQKVLVDEKGLCRPTLNSTGRESLVNPTGCRLQREGLLTLVTVHAHTRQLTTVY